MKKSFSFFEKCLRTPKSARRSSPKCFEKKIPFGRIIPQFFFESSESDSFFIYLQNFVMDAHPGVKRYWRLRVQRATVPRKTHTHYRPRLGGSPHFTPVEAVLFHPPKSGAGSTSCSQDEVRARRFRSPTSEALSKSHLSSDGLTQV